MSVPARRLPEDYYTRLLAELAEAQAVGLSELDCPWPGTYFIFPGDEQFPLYRLLAPGQPVYIGKTGGKARTLTSRVREHRDSIAHAHNLCAEHMQVKVLALHPDEQDQAPAIEEYFQRHFQPLWNKPGPLTGLGNHGVGTTRMTQAATNWDTVHPGRPGRSAEQRQLQEALLLQAIEHLRARPHHLAAPLGAVDESQLIAGCLPHRAETVAVAHQMALTLG